MTKKYIRKITKCYVVEEISPYPTEIIKICRSKKLAEHYVRVLSPKWKDAFGLDLGITEYPFYEDKTHETEIVEIADDEDIEKIGVESDGD